MSVLEKFAPVKGTCCEISGLVSAPHHNGRRCKLVSLENNGRWTVRLEDSAKFWGVAGQQLSLKAGNLSAAPSKPLVEGTRCAISGLVSAPHHNGSRCTLVSLANGRWTVRLEDGNSTEISLKPVNLTAVPRRRVKRPRNAPKQGGSGGPAKKALAEHGGSGNGGLVGNPAKKTAEEEAAEGAGIRASTPELQAEKTAAASSKGGAKKRQRTNDDDSSVDSDSAELEYETGSEVDDGVFEKGSDGWLDSGAILMRARTVSGRAQDSQLRGYTTDSHEDTGTNSAAFQREAAASLSAESGVA